MKSINKEKGVWIVYDLEANREIQNLLIKKKFAFRFYPNLDKEFLELVEDIDLELMLTDIKNKEGKKIPESDELMRLFGIFWEHIKKKIESKLKEK